MSLSWQGIQLRPGRIMFLASDHRLHSVPSESIWQAREIDPDLIVLADSPESWQAFLTEQSEIERTWNLRNTLTVADRQMLREVGVEWNDHRDH